MLLKRYDSITVDIAESEFQNMSKSVDIRQRRNKSRQFGGMSSRGLRGRMSQSYTDINTQISDQSTPGLSMDAQTRSIDRRTLKQSSQKSSLDYAFLRELLGINLRGGGRATSNHEGFVSDELKEAVMKLRQEVKDLKLEIKDKNWLKTLEDLGDLNDMDKDFLESLYMLRNAYKKGVFSSTQTVNVSTCTILVFHRLLCMLSICYVGMNLKPHRFAS